MKKNILITGGCGFIGSNLANDLAQIGCKIYVLDDLSVGSAKKLNKSKNIFLIRKNINRITNLKINKKIDCCIHLAAKAEITIDKSKEKQYFDDNIAGLQNVLKFCSEQKIKNFIFASSASVYGDTKNKNVKENFKLNPLHYYAYTKYIGEKIVQNYSRLNNMSFYILRFFNVYGNKSNAVVAKFIAQFLQKKKITIYGDGEQSRDFVHVTDVIDAIKMLINKNIKSDIFNIGSSKSYKINLLKDLITNSKNYIHLDKRFDDIEISISNINKIKNILGWKPKINFKKGINKIIEEDKNRLIKKKIEKITNQINSIKKFNKKNK